jgi:hypothetical protein
MIIFVRFQNTAVKPLGQDHRIVKIIVGSHPRNLFRIRTIIGKGKDLKGEIEIERKTDLYIADTTVVPFLIR